MVVAPHPGSVSTTGPGVSQVIINLLGANIFIKDKTKTSIDTVSRARNT